MNRAATITAYFTQTASETRKAIPMGTSDKLIATTRVYSSLIFSLVTKSPASQLYRHQLDALLVKQDEWDYIVMEATAKGLMAGKETRDEALHAKTEYGMKDAISLYDFYSVFLFSVANSAF